MTFHSIYNTATVIWFRERKQNRCFFGLHSSTIDVPTLVISPPMGVWGATNMQEKSYSTKHNCQNMYNLSSHAFSKKLKRKETKKKINTQHWFEYSWHSPKWTVSLLIVCFANEHLYSCIVDIKNVVEQMDSTNTSQQKSHF